MLRSAVVGRLRDALLISGLAGIACLAVAGQKPIGSGSGSGLPGQSSANPHNPATLGSDNDIPPSPFPDTSGQKRNSERQRKIVSDTERLLYLTSQLKGEVAASGSETLTPEMLHQTEEIEKLARSVKDKMRN